MSFSSGLLVVSLLVALVASGFWVALKEEPTRFSAETSSPFRDHYGDWAIVAGASEGLGAAWAEALCQFQVNVLLIARREAALQSLAEDLVQRYPGVSVDYWVQDLADPNLDEVFQEHLTAHSNTRKYGLLVYNAAHNQVGHFLEVPLPTLYTTLNVNTRGVVQMTHVFGHYLTSRQQTGGMVLMSSMSGELGNAYIANYAATKAWNTAFAHGLHHELKDQGIDVLACVAGATTTPNYLKLAEQVQSVRNPQIELTAQEVVRECIQGIGVRSSIRPGVMNKLVRFLFVRLLPLELALSIYNKESGKVLFGTAKKES